MFAGIRRHYWILKGRQAKRKYQFSCFECRKLKGKPTMPRMANLPPHISPLSSPPFSQPGWTALDPSLGRHHKKRWGILFKCQTTRCIHVETLDHLDTDSFLLAFCWFVSRRGSPAELISDQGTNSMGGSENFRRRSLISAQDCKRDWLNHKYALCTTLLMHPTSAVPGRERYRSSRLLCLLLLEVRLSPMRC